MITKDLYTVFRTDVFLVIGLVAAMIAQRNTGSACRYKLSLGGLFLSHTTLCRLLAPLVLFFSHNPFLCFSLVDHLLAGLSVANQAKKPKDVPNRGTKHEVLSLVFSPVDDTSASATAAANRSRLSWGHPIAGSFRWIELGV